MANNCYFEMKLVGKEEVKEVAGYFLERYGYNFLYIIFFIFKLFII